MIINGTHCPTSRACMSIFLDGHLAGNKPNLIIEVSGENMEMKFDGETETLQPRIHISVPLPVQDWRSLERMTINDTDPGVNWLAWWYQPQMSDVQSFGCKIGSRSGGTFAVEIKADVICHDFADGGIPVSMSVIELFTLAPISVGVPMGSKSPAEDAVQLLTEHIDLGSLSAPIVIPRRDANDNLVAYEVHFPIPA